ncbi:Neur-chan-LBD domain-containing protein [Aphelenchoides besseyi]|nr:Neur-chan-LBD domain-containing protein [Aphelenchoides besseyi]
MQKHDGPALAMNSRSNSTGMSTTSMLMNELFANYDRRIRPFAEEHRPVQVHMSIVLGILIDIRENEQIACYVISHVQRWTDLRLKWRPREWNGTKELIAPLSNIWLPRIFVYNSMVTTDMLPPEKYDVRIKHTGEIKINIPQYLEAICRLSIENFPFDYEYCAIALASPLLTTNEMECFAHQPLPDQSYFAGNAEWELINVTARHMTFKEEEEVRAEVHYIFLFKRRAIFYIAVIVIPIMLISALSLMGIFSIVSDNEARNDKAGLGLSSLLSLSVILGILSDALPRTNSLPLLGIYILCVIIICALAVCLSLILSTLSRKLVEKGRVPSSFTYRLVCLQPKKFTKSRVSRHSIFRPSLTVTLTNGVDKTKTNATTIGNPTTKPEDCGFQFQDLAKIYKAIGYLAEEQRHIKRKVDRRQMKLLIEQEWYAVFSRINFALLVIFELLNSASLLFFLQYAFTPPQPMREPLLLYFLLLSTVQSINANPSELLDRLLSKYDKRVRPFADEQKPVTIQMTIVLSILTELRENEQTASFVRLQWNPDENQGLKQLVVPVSLLWIPKLFIYNSVETKDMLTSERFDARVQHTGEIRINLPQYVSTICRLQIELYPFDVQFCAVAIASPLLNTNEQIVNATQPPKDSYFTGNAEWEIKQVTVRSLSFMEDGEYRVEVHYIMHLHRRPVYYLTVVVAPCFLISSLSILGVFSPTDDNSPRGERVSLGLGSLLALVVLLDIVATSLPRSNSIPLLGYFIIAIILLCASAVAVSTLLLGLNRKLIDSHKMPSNIAYTIALLRAPKKPRDYWQAGLNNMDYFDGLTVTPPKFPDLAALFNRVQEIAQTQIEFRKMQQKRKWYNAIEKEWNRVFSRIDYLLLFIFEALNLLILILFLRQSWIPVPELPSDFSV